MSLDAIWPNGAVLQFNCTEPGTQVASRESSSRSPSKRTKTSDFVEAANDAVIRRALRIMESRLKYHDVALNSPQAVRDYLRLRLADLEWEVFVVLFLDAQNRLIACEELFRGTLTQTSVYPEGGCEGRSQAQRSGRDLRAQPSLGRGRTEPRRRASDADAQTGVGID
jgi:hypothetical protein